MSGRMLPAVSLPQPVPTATPQLTLDSLARQGYSRVQAEPDSCQTHRYSNRLAQRRARDAARPALPQPITSPEQLAAAKYQAAHSLWKAGQSAAAKRWLQTLVASYPQTEAADKAKGVLAKL